MIRPSDGAAGAWCDLLRGRARLVCLLCDREADPAALFAGCTACGVAAPLTVAYQAPPRSGHGIAAAVREARARYLAFAPPPGAFPSCVPTPLARAPRLGPGVLLKCEAYSLTGSHKDRYHAVAASLARCLGSRGIVATSTGNHGVSAAAHAAAHGLPAVVFCHPRAPSGLLRAIGAFGGLAAQLAPAAQRSALGDLVSEGWFPATSMDPVLSGAANPIAAEGYKLIAYEVVEQLGEMPDVAFVPTAGGDTYYGVARGFAELAALSGAPMPVVVAVQPVGANPLSRSIAAARQVAVANPTSIALSLSDERTGRQAMVALERWGGRALDVAESAIREALRDLASMGIYADPASAAALAGYRHAVRTGTIAPDARSVLLLTASGFKWPDAMAAVFPAGAVRSGAELRQWLANHAGSFRDDLPAARQPLATAD